MEYRTQIGSTNIVIDLQSRGRGNRMEQRWSCQQTALDQSDIHKKLNLRSAWGTDLTPFTKTNSEWIIDLNIKWKTLKLLEDKIRENLDDLRYGDDFLGTILNAPFMKERIDMLDFIKIKNFSPASVLVTWSCLILGDPMDCNPPGSSVYGVLQARILEWAAIPFSRRPSTQGLKLGFLHCRRILCQLSHQGNSRTMLKEWEDKLWTRGKYLQKKHTGLFSKMYKELLKCSTKNAVSLIKKWTKMLTDTSLKMCWWQVSRDTHTIGHQVNVKMRYYHILIRKAKSEPWQQQMLPRIRNSKNSDLLLVGMQSDTATLKTVYFLTNLSIL